MTTQALLNIIPPVIAAGAVLYIANRAMSLGNAKKAWPQHKVRAYKVVWGSDSPRKRGKRVIYGPNMASATEAFEEKYPDRYVVDIEEA